VCVRFYIYKGDEFIERRMLIQHCSPPIFVDLHMVVNNTKHFHCYHGNVVVVSLCIVVELKNTSYYFQLYKHT
jgi:hypothetical protein